MRIWVCFAKRVRITKFFMNFGFHEFWPAWILVFMDFGFHGFWFCKEVKTACSRPFQGPCNGFPGGFVGGFNIGKTGLFSGLYSPLIFCRWSCS